MIGYSDEAQLAYCRSESRIIITADADFLRLLKNDADHSGVIYWASNKHFGQIVSDIDAMCFTMTAVEFREKIFYL